MSPASSPTTHRNASQILNAVFSTNAPALAASSTPISPDVNVIENTHAREITSQRVKKSAS